MHSTRSSHRQGPLAAVPRKRVCRPTTAVTHSHTPAVGFRTQPTSLATATQRSLQAATSTLAAPSRHVAALAGTGVWGAANDGGDGGDGDYEEIGPAFQATLQMLEWPRLCSHVAEFASTHVGKRACKSMQVPEDPQESERLLKQTRSATADRWPMHQCPCLRWSMQSLLRVARWCMHVAVAHTPMHPSPHPTP